MYRTDTAPVGNLFGPELGPLGADEVAAYRLRLDDLRLAPGRYYCAVSVGQGDPTKGRSEFDIIRDVLHFEVMASEGDEGVMSEWYPSWGAVRFAQPMVSRLD